MSRRSRRQTRHRTFGWRAEYASPPRHNDRVRLRKAVLKSWRISHSVAAAFRALRVAASLAAAQFSGLVAAQASVEDAFAQQKASVS